MRSKFILGLFCADKDTLANFIAIWNETTLTNILIHKGSDSYEKIIKKENADSFSKEIESKTEELKNIDIDDLRNMIIMQLSSYFDIRLPKTFNMHSLEEVGLKIENTALKTLKKSDKEFSGNSTDDMIARTFEKLFNEMEKRFEKADENTQEEIVDNIFDSIKKMPEDQKERLKEELEVDEITKDVLRKALTAGTLGTAFAVIISVAGFSAYTLATAVLASLAALIGVTLPFSVYTTLTSVIAVLSDPFFLLAMIGILYFGLNKKSNSSIKDSLSPIIVSLISILYVEEDERYLCKCEEYIHQYNDLILKYKKANEKEKSILQNRMFALKGVKFEEQSVFNLAVVPSSTFATCDQNMWWLNGSVSNTSTYDKLKRYFDKTYDIYADETNFTIASLTIGDMIYDMSRIDPLVIESVDFARKEDIVDMFSFAYFSENINLDSTGDISQLKGYVAERLIAQQLQSQGYEVEFPAASNQAGYDLLVNGQPFQVKCGESPSLVNDHLEKYDEIPVLVNEELGESFIDNDMVFPIQGISNDKITELTKINIDAGSEILDYEIPLWTLAVVSGKNIFQVLQNKIDIENALGKTVEESTARITGAFVGSNLLMLGGMIWMPAAGVVGGLVGAVLGSITVASLVDKLKLTTLMKDETFAIDQAIKKILAKSIPIAENNLKIAEKKFGSTIRILKEKGEKDILRYLEYRYIQELTYRKEKIDLMKKVLETEAIILDEETSNILVSAQNTLIITQQVGVYPYNLKKEVSVLFDSVEKFNDSMSTSQITKSIKGRFRKF